MSAIGWADLGNVRPIRGFDKEALKREIPLDWLLWKAGVQLAPDSSGSRLEGVCPFGQHNGLKFTVRLTDAGEQVAGCWSCPDKQQGDLFEVIRWLTGEPVDVPFGKLMQAAGSYAALFKADEEWKNRPPVVLVAAPKMDPAVFTSDASLCLQAAYANPRLIKQLIERKAATDPGWRLLTPEFLMAQWRVGVEPDQTVTRGVSNPDAAAYSQDSHVVLGTRVIVPHFSYDETSGNWIVRALKTRNAEFGHLFAAGGSDLKAALYGVWRMRGADWVLVCEGEGDAWCASAVPEIAARMDVVSVSSGVKGMPKPEYLAPLAGKNVIIGFDGDTDGRYWAGKWVEALAGVAASVWAIPVPDEKDLAAADDLLGLVRSAVRVDGPEIGEGAADATEGPGRFFGGKDGIKVQALASAVLEEGHLAAGTDSLIWAYRDGVWVSARHEVRNRVVALLGDRYRGGHASNTEDVVRAAVPEITCGPVGQLINFRNGLYDWRAHHLFDHTPEILSTVQLSTELRPDAVCPAFDAFLASVLPADMQQTAWELIGYLMYSGNPLHKAVMLTGEGRNGKGTFLRAVNALLGKQNISAVDLHALLNRPFAAASLFGKLANIAGDIDATYLENTAILKAITGEDLISAEHKGRDRFDFEAWAVPVFSANEIPASADTTVGYLSRWLVINFPFSFLGREDRGLDKRITTPDELAGIAWKGVHALRTLMDRGQFLVTASSEEARRNFVRGVDQIHTWADECAVIDPSLPHVNRTLLYKQYKSWAMENGFGPLKSSKFYDRLASSEMQYVQSVTVRGVRGFTGIALVGAPLTWDNL